MLESRPIVQKSLAGAGAFMFVFAAAMAGTGVMISGGIGLPHRDASADMIGSATAPADWDIAETDLNTTQVRPVSYTPPQPERIDSAVTLVPPHADDQSSFAGAMQTQPTTAASPDTDESSSDVSSDDTQADGVDDSLDTAKKN